MAGENLRKENVREMRVAKTLKEVETSISGDGIVIVEVGSSACAPCKALRVRLEAFLEDRPIVGWYVSIEDIREIGAEFGVLSVPTIMLFIDGKKYLSDSGCFSLDEFLETTEKYRKMRGGHYSPRFLRDSKEKIDV